MDDGAFQPPIAIRQREAYFNQAFDDYRDQYYNGGVSSVYCWEQQKGGWAACFAIKKVLEGEHSDVQGFWDAVHVVDAQEEMGTYVIAVTSSFLFNLEVVGGEDPDAACAGKPPPICFSGQCSRTNERTLELTTRNNIDTKFLEVIGVIIENAESHFRTRLEKVYLAKAPEISEAMTRGRIGGSRSPKRSLPQGS